jgi:DNA-binding LytR/AlgR family response regulator
MRLALCDDDKALVSELKPMIYEYANKHRFDMVIDEYYSGEDLIKSPTAYDMIFLDYQMGGLNGLSTARRLRERNMNGAITFMTAFPDFVYQAFEVSAFRFLIKPLTQCMIYAVLDDYFRMHGSDYPIFIYHEKTAVQVNTKDIVLLEATNKHCLIHFANEWMCVCKTMAKVSELLPQCHFYKVNRAFTVNFSHINRYKNDQIHFHSGQKVYVSRKYLKAFKNAYMEYSDLRSPKRRETNH